MKIGYLMSSSSRRAGGLLWATSNLAKSIQRLGPRVRVFAGLDPDTADDLYHWENIPVVSLNQVGPASFGYMPSLSRHLHEDHCNLVHTHGLWMYTSIATHQWARRTVKPYLVSPHGMLDSWAVRNSALKKQLASLAYENRHLRDAACLHALCEAEYTAIRAYGLKNPIAIIPNGVDCVTGHPDAAPPAWAKLLPAGAKSLLFLSRIHPKKGLQALLEAWAFSQENNLEAQRWHLIIAGWDQGGHAAELKRQSHLLGTTRSVHFVGPQFDEDKVSTFLRADAFVLPSLSEGLPIAVLEAWSYGLPVLMTPQCNLPEGFATNAAICAEPDAHGLAVGLSILFNMTDDEHTACGYRGRDLINSRFTWPKIANQMLDVYRWVLGHGDKPLCVRLD